MAKDDTTQAIVGLVKSLIKKERGNFSTFVQATFVAADTVDSNLSTITVLGTTVRKVRKGAHVGTLTAGQQLICIQGNGIPLTILMAPVGDITRTG